MYSSLSGITPNHSSTLFNEASSLKPGAHGDGHLTNQLALGFHGPCLLSAGITDRLPHPPDTYVNSEDLNSSPSAWVVSKGAISRPFHGLPSPSFPASVRRGRKPLLLSCPVVWVTCLVGSATCWI